MLEKHEDNQCKMSPGNFIRINKQRLANWNAQRFVRLREMCDSGMEKAEQVISRKNDMNEMDRKRFYFYLHKWEILKIKKRELLDVKIAERDRRVRKRTHISMI